MLKKIERYALSMRYEGESSWKKSNDQNNYEEGFYISSDINIEESTTNLTSKESTQYKEGEEN